MELEEIRAFFAHDRYATEQTGIEIMEAEKHYARCRLVLDDRHKNAMGGVMGGVMFTLADFAFAIASNLDSPPTVSLSSTIAYTGAPKGKELIASAEPVKDGRSTCVYTVRITDDLGNEVAFVTITGFKKV